ncbi:spore germination protein [Pullulanibacillus camelliae]|uniref:Spore germination protein n=1 Tax=Pullulanibacillus camelliae TaxID=1707096 RepID=A0A8J2VSJ9_9BACL|nr:spore germination protein [Pullulanibacillus camelliae]GGE40275.1 spore germination protein [Pullulanibacillus camelliae]
MKLFQKRKDKAKSQKVLQDKKHAIQKVYHQLHNNEEWLHRSLDNCQDIIIKRIDIENWPILIAYCEGMVDVKLLNISILPHLRNLVHRVTLKDKQAEHEQEWITFPSNTLDDLNQVVSSLFDGELLVFIDQFAQAYSFNISEHPKRQPEETNTELSIRGARDGFIEELSVNTALVRKRLRTPSMVYEKLKIGSRGETDIGLIYIKDIIKPEIVSNLKQRLNSISIDTVGSSAELEGLLQNKRLSLFPIFGYTGRPDFVVDAVLRGRFALLVDGSPTAIIGPANLSFLLKSTEDKENNALLTSIERLIRLLALAISVLLPGFFIALSTFHPDQLPLPLLSTIVMSRKGVPMPTPIEAILMLLLFEIFSEAGKRLPNAIGQTLGVVGGLVIGDAAISGGFTSPTMLVVIALTIVSSFTITNQSLQGVVKFLRLFTVVWASFLGIYGFLLSFFIILTYLANLRPFGIPYLAPASPFNGKDLAKSLLRPMMLKNKERPNLLQPTDPDRTSDEK